MHVALSINARGSGEARDLLMRARAIVPAGGWVHIDVGDGVYTPQASWGDALEFAEIAKEMPDINAEVHLMAEDYEDRIVPWLEAGAKRVIVQADLLRDAEYLMELGEKYGATMMLSVPLHIPASDLVPYFGKFSGFQILCVTPGNSGQAFQEDALLKIAAVRAAAPDAILEADGGMTADTARRAKEAGADILVSSSYVWNNSDPAAAYAALAAI